ncbi:MAG: NAD(P)/FAD-dependent oxidoreductase [Rhizobiaceae bacterium]
MSPYDHIIVGSGINSLVCAALLGKAGKKVLLLERNDMIGGCIRTEEIIAPGFVHDVLATTFVLFTTSPAYRELADDLARHGLEFCQAKFPTGVLLPNGNSALITMDREENIAMFNKIAAGDGDAHREAVESIEQNADLIFGLLGSDLWSWRTALMLAKQARKRGLRGLASFFGESLGTARHWLESDFHSEISKALWAPWVLHTGLGPESSYSAQMGRVIAFAIEAAGAPVVKGGAKNILAAFQALIEENGGEIRTCTDVDKIIVEGGRAAGVMLTDGEKLRASSGIICSVTPNQFYNRLLESPASTDADATQKFKPGKSNFQLHYALNGPLKWNNSDLNDVALLHITDGLDGVSKASNEAERGMLPETPTICLGQPSSFDSTRAPAGKAILWLQMPETPRHIKGDTSGVINVPEDGKWNEQVREAYADRIENILRQHIVNFDELVIGRKAISPADLEVMNMNLEGGDPYGGYCGLDQFFIWRPFKHSKNHNTNIKYLFHIGASTHPGPGLGGGSGYLVAKRLS